MVIMKFDYEKEIFDEALEIMQAINADVEGLRIIREKCERMLEAGLMPTVNIYDDLSVEITATRIKNETLH